MKNENQKTLKLRLWPGILFAIIIVIARFIIPPSSNEILLVSIFSGLIFSLLTIIWWAFFSKALKSERLIGSLLFVGVPILAFMLLDKSIATGGQGTMYFMYSLPIASVTFVIWALITKNLKTGTRRISMIVTVFIAFGFWLFLRNDGITGDFQLNLAWRWATTHEEELLADKQEEASSVKIDSSLLNAEVKWSGFRGENRNGVISNIKIDTDWTKNPPKQLWKKPVGPGCSSFASLGNLIYTQEQRGEYEMVTCYELETGILIWQHKDSTRFWDSHAGAGPRSTPTIHKGKIYTLGATGLLNVLDAFTGNVVWSKNAASDTKVQIPGWAYSSSPLIVDELVYVAISGQILAYKISDGSLKWKGEDGGESYSSPHYFNCNGTVQIVFMNKSGVTAYSPEDGKVLWQSPAENVPIVQPIVLNQNTIIVDKGDISGAKCLEIKKQADGWKPELKWESNRLRPYFNDFVLHKGFIFGYEGNNLICFDIKQGKRKWKGDRCGGQLLLLKEQDKILVLTEKGEILLIEASIEEYKEIARIKAIEGKTWNHPVLVDDVFMVRNGEEMAAFKLKTL